MCERRHALVDKIIEKMLLDNPGLDLQVCADLACLAKNSEISRLGYSSLQIANGKNPLIPGMGSDYVPTDTNQVNPEDPYLSHLSNLYNIREEFRRAESSDRYKRFIRCTVPSATDRFFEVGEQVYWWDDLHPAWRRGQVSVIQGSSNYKVTQ